jgi:glycosyltransferase involved in cell wall biosynthesis
MLHRVLWQQIRLPLAITRDRCDVFLGPATIVPSAPGPPSVSVVYDCLPFIFPSSKPYFDRNYWQFWIRRSVERATRVVAISESTARDCRDILGLDAGKIEVVHPGVNASFFHPITDADREEKRRTFDAAGVGGSPYILQVGGYQAHKGIDVAIEAIQRLRRAGHDLILVSCGPGLRPRTDNLEAVVHLGLVNESALRALYADASAVCIPSLHEGFGFIALEAMAIGTPVVAAASGALPETAGQSAMFAEPANPESMASALELTLADEVATSARVASGRARAASFTWERAASSMFQTLRTVSGRA